MNLPIKMTTLPFSSSDKQRGPMALCLAIALALSLSACDSAAIEGEDLDQLTLSSLTCNEEGVNNDPFLVSDALLQNSADHESADDYSYDASSATTISLDGSAIAVNGNGATANGSIVTVTAPGTYIVSGTLTDGQVVVDSQTDGAVKLVLSDMSITNSFDSGIIVAQSDLTVLILADGTSNSVTDGLAYPDLAEQNAAIWSDDDLSIGGSGSLTVNGRFEDGIGSKDGLVIREGMITIEAPDEGIRGKDYLVIRGGTLDITAGGDGLKSDEDSDESLGYVLIDGGDITVDADADAVSAETDALILTGTLQLRSGGGADVSPSSVTSSKGFKGGVLAVIDDAILNIDASDDAIHSNGSVIINDGTIEIATGEDAVHADITLTVNNGNILVTKSYEGLESVFGDLIVNGGTLDITASDDGFNLAGDGDDPGGVETPGDPYDMVFNGGRIKVTAGNDGIDSNGFIVMTGGCLAIDGPIPGTRPEQGAIDYNGDFEMSGGVLVAAGAAGRHAQTPGTISTQPTLALTFSSSQPGGTLITLGSDQGSIAIEPGKTFQSLIVSAPWLTTDSAVSLYRDGAVSSTAAEGFFDGGTVSDAAFLNRVTPSSIITSVTL